MAKRAWAAWAAPLVAAGMMLLTFATAGCTCQTLVEVDACFEDRRDCNVAPEDVRPWDASLAQAWPQLDETMASLEPGDHAHPAWHGDSDAFWRDVRMDPDDARNRVFVERDGSLFRIRFVEC